MDITTLTDEELAQLRSDVSAETERRAQLASIPAQILGLAEDYVAGGGDLADLSLPAAE